MPESIESIDARRGITRTEHVLKSVLNCSVDKSRMRLIEALEHLGYHVTADDPLQARRPARGAARYYLSANILEYPTRLSIGLREIGPGTTLATLDYVSEHPGGLSFKGDLDTQKREAEAIIALARADRARAKCGSCGTAQIAEGRYCRVCGAPTVGREPSELEMLRVTAGARSGHHLIASGALLTSGALIASFVMYLISGVPGVALGIMSWVAATGLVLVFLGISALSKALAGKPSETPSQQVETGALRQIAAHDEINALPPQSVTEATTSLLDPSPRLMPEPVFFKRRDTSEIDD